MTVLAYKAALTNSFLRELRKLSNDVRERTLDTIDEIISNPYLGVRLRGELEGRWRWRIGKYRIIYIIEEKPQVVVFLDVGPRRAIYE